MNTTWRCDWCLAETRTGHPNTFPDRHGCFEPRNTNGGMCQWVVVRPANDRDYSDLTTAARKPDWCKPCQKGGMQPYHWPSPNCGGGTRPGGPVRTHCTCPACF